MPKPTLGITKVIDPFMDRILLALTSELVEKAWAHIKEIESYGGYDGLQ